MPRKKKLVRKARKAETIRQVAAVPCRLNEAGEVEIMLVTSCSTQRFIIPKGWPMKGRTDARAAAIEAEEEAGVRGKVLRDPIGTYSYWKRLTDCFVPVEVTVYVLMVTSVAKRWQEGARRRRAWLGVDAAVLLADEPQLAAILKEAPFARLLRSSKAA